MSKAQFFDTSGIVMLLAAVKQFSVILQAAVDVQFPWQNLVICEILGIFEYQRWLFRRSFVILFLVYEQMFLVLYLQFFNCKLKRRKCSM